jgi:hypothetical protein
LAVTTARLIAQQEIISRVQAQEIATAKPPVSPAPSEDFKLPVYDLSTQPSLFSAFEPTPRVTFTATSSPPTEQDKGVLQTLLELAKLQPTAGNILPGAIGEASREILKNMAITLALAGVGYALAGWKGALAGTLVWIGPNIPAALEAKRKIEAGEFLTT